MQSWFMLFQRLEHAFALTQGLAEHLDGGLLARRNGGARSNTIGSQFWCIVGARESYTRAIAKGRWSGFTCSLDAHRALDADAVRTALQSGRA